MVQCVGLVERFALGLRQKRQPQNLLPQTSNLKPYAITMSLFEVFDHGTPIINEQNLRTKKEKSHGRRFEKDVSHHHG